MIIYFILGELTIHVYAFFRSNMEMNEKELHKMLQPPDEMKDDKQKPKLHC